jgi:predicted secreted protein
VNIFSGILVYILTWWMVFFCMLPLGIKNIEKPEGGSMPGAPVNPGLTKKLIFTTLISAIVWGGIYAIIKSDLLSFRDIAAGMRM